MNIALKPEHEKLIEELVTSGRYVSAEQVVADALSRLMHYENGGAGVVEEEIDDETFAALQRSEEQITRGEGLSLSEVRGHFRRRGVGITSPRTRSGK